MICRRVQRLHISFIPARGQNNGLCGKNENICSNRREAEMGSGRQPNVMSMMENEKCSFRADCREVCD